MSISLNTEMPKGITRSYGTSFREMLAEAAPKVLSIKDLDDLDDAELKAVIETPVPVKLGNEAA